MPKYRVTITTEFETDEPVPVLNFSGTADQMENFVANLPEFDDMEEGPATFKVEKID